MLWKASKCYIPKRRQSSGLFAVPLQPCLTSLTHNKYHTAKTNPTANYGLYTEHNCQQRYKRVYYRAGCYAFWVTSKPLENKLSNSEKKNCSIIQGQIYFQFRGNVYISSSLTLPNTVISLIKAVYKGVRAYVIVIYVNIFHVPSYLPKSYIMHSTLSYVWSATTHHHRVSSCRCLGT
jgi:hypothetical protein